MFWIFEDGMCPIVVLIGFPLFCLEMFPWENKWEFGVSYSWLRVEVLSLIFQVLLCSCFFFSNRMERKEYGFYFVLELGIWPEANWLKRKHTPREKGVDDLGLLHPIYIIYTVRFETCGDLSMILFFIIRLKHWDLVFILLFFIISRAKYDPSYTLYIFILLETIYSGLEHCSCFWKGWGNSTKCLPFMMVDIASLVHCG